MFADDDGERHRLGAPLAQVTDSVRGEDLCFGAESLERMAGDVEAEDFFFLCQTLGLGPRRDVGKAVRGPGLLRLACRGAEERRLPGHKVFLLERGLSDGEIERCRELRAVTSERIHRSGVEA